MKRLEGLRWHAAPVAILMLSLSLGAIALTAVVLGILTHYRLNDQVQQLRRISVQTSRLARETATLAREQARQGRFSCERNNVAREALAQVLEQELRQTDALLKKGLGSLEPFRGLIIDQNEQRRATLKGLRIPLRNRYTPNRRYALDCARFFPYSTGGRRADATAPPRPQGAAIPPSVVVIVRPAHRQRRGPRPPALSAPVPGPPFGRERPRPHPSSTPRPPPTPPPSPAPPPPAAPPSPPSPPPPSNPLAPLTEPLRGLVCRLLPSVCR